VNKYRIDRSFVVPEPTPADHFWCLPDPGAPEARQKAIGHALDQWRKRDEIRQVRVTLTGPDIEGDETAYPSGIWLEGWNDERARQLPFGSPWPTKDGAIWPPLTACDPKGPDSE